MSFFCFIAVCIGLTGGTAAIGLGLGGILGLEIATVSGFCASYLGYKLKNKFHYGKEKMALNKNVKNSKLKLQKLSTITKRRHVGEKCYQNDSIYCKNKF